MNPTGEAQLLQGREELRDGVIELIGRARRALWVATASMEPAVFMDASVIDTLKRQLLAERRLQLCILVSDARGARRNADRLLQLVRRLPSQFLIHEPGKPDLAFEHDVWIADHAGHLKRESHRALHTQFVSHQALNTRRMRDSFQQSWHQSVSSPEFRQLS